MTESKNDFDHFDHDHFDHFDHFLASNLPHQQNKIALTFVNRNTSVVPLHHN